MESRALKDIFVNGIGWLDMEKPAEFFGWPGWDETEVTILKTLYPRYGSEICSLALGKSLSAVRAKASNLNLRRHRPPCPDNQGRVA